MRGQAAPTPGQWFQLGLCRKESGTLIGDCGLFLSEQMPRHAAIGITLCPASQKSGCAREALRAVIAYLFSALDMHRITASVDPSPPLAGLAEIGRHAPGGAFRRKRLVQGRMGGWSGFCPAAKRVGGNRRHPALGQATREARTRGGVTGMGRHRAGRPSSRRTRRIRPCAWSGRGASACCRVPCPVAAAGRSGGGRLNAGKRWNTVGIGRWHGRAQSSHMRGAGWHGGRRSGRRREGKGKPADARPAAPETVTVGRAPARWTGLRPDRSDPRS